jgi:hypothetical protein
MESNEELIQVVNEIKAGMRHFSSQMVHMGHELNAISGGLAVVLNRSEENRQELADVKKNLTQSPQNLKRTKSVLRDWRVLYRLPRKSRPFSVNQIPASLSSQESPRARGD